MAESTPYPIPPYVPLGSLTTFLDSLKEHGVPARIDRSVMGKVAGSMQNWILHAMKFFRMIDDKGMKQPVLEEMVAADDVQKAALWNQLITDGYPYLFDGFDLNASTARMFEERLAQQTGASGDTVRKCAAFFLAAAKLAGIPVSAHIVNGLSKRRPSNGGRRRSGESAVRENNGVPDPPPAPPDPADGKGGWHESLLAKFPTFDPAWPEDVQRKWFEAFERLMTKG